MTSNGCSAQRPTPSPSVPPTPDRSSGRPVWQSFVMGSLAACGAVTATNPFDVAKTRIVLQGQLQGASAQQALVYAGPLQTLISIVRNEGLLALMKGLGPAYATQIFMNGTRLGLYPNIKRNLKRSLPADVPDFFVSMVSGSAAGMVGAACGSPFQMVKIRMQAYSSKANMGVGAQHNYSSLGHGLVTVCREEGFRGLRRAVDACMLKVAVASAVQLSIYDFTKQKLESSKAWPLECLNATARHIAASVTASFCVVSVINPIEVINTRLYNQSSSMYLGMADCFRKTVQTEGAGALYKGWGAHFLRVAPHTVLTFVLLEAMNSRFSKRQRS